MLKPTKFFTDSSLCILLTALIVQYGFKTKTQLQQLFEGKIEFKPPKNKKQKENDKKTKAQQKTGQQKLEIKEKETYTTLYYFT